MYVNVCKNLNLKIFLYVYVCMYVCIFYSFFPRIQQVIECDLGLATSVSMEDVCTLFSALDNAVNKLIHVGSSEVSAHPHLCMYVCTVCMYVCMYVSM